MSSMWFRALAVPMLAAALIAPALAQNTVATKDLDTKLDAALYDVTRIGTDLYNRQNNEEGCYRMYEGGLRAALAALDHHPNLKNRINDALRKAATETPPARSLTLRAALDDARKTVRPSKAAMPTGSDALWLRLGGEPAVRKVVKEFVVAAAKDPKVDFDRGGNFKIDAPKLEKLLVEFISATTGGPVKYSGRAMKSSHAGMKITGAQFDAAAGHLVATLKANKVPQKEADELVAIVASTKKDIVEGTAAPPPPPPPSTKTLWERLGGEAAVKAVVKDFVAVTMKDPKVNVDRDGKFKLDAKAVENLEKQLVDMISAVTGGLRKYTGRDMKTAHAGMKITEAEFNASAGHLVDTLKKYKVPEKEIDELMAIIGTTKDDIVEVK